MSTQRAITWTRPKLEEFKKAYEKAEEEHRTSFNFEKAVFIPAYAKYLIQYLETKL